MTRLPSTMNSLSSILQPHSYNLHVKFERVDVKTHEQPLHTRHIHLTPENSRIPVGRSSTSAARILNPEDDNMWIACPVVSRKHAELYTVCDVGSEPSLHIRDDGSSGGTFVNEVPLFKGTSQKLVNGDVIRFGIEVTRELEVFKPPQYQVNIVPLLPINDSPSTLDTPGRSFHCNLESSDVSDMSRSEFDSDEENQSDHELYSTYNYGDDDDFDDEEEEVDDEEKGEEYPAAQNCIEHTPVGWFYDDEVAEGVNKGLYEVPRSPAASAYEAITSDRPAISEPLSFVEELPTLIAINTDAVQRAVESSGLVPVDALLAGANSLDLSNHAEIEQKRAATKKSVRECDNIDEVCSRAPIGRPVNDRKRKREDEEVGKESSPTMIVKLPVNSTAARPIKKARLGYLKVAAASALAGSIGTLGLLAALPVGFFD